MLSQGAFENFERDRDGRGSFGTVINSIAYANSGLSVRCVGGRAPASAAPGIGIVIPDAASIRRAKPTAIHSSKELLQEWNWKEHYSGQPETRRYI